MKVLPTYHFLDRYCKRVLHNDLRGLSDIWKLDFVLAKSVRPDQLVLFEKLCNTYIHPNEISYFNHETRTLFILKKRGKKIHVISTCLSVPSMAPIPDIHQWYNTTKVPSLLRKVEEICGDLS